MKKKLEMPSAIFAEEQMIGGCFNHEDIVDLVINELDDSYFTQTQTKTLFAAIKKLRSEGATINDVLVCDYLKKANLMAAAGGDKYLFGIILNSRGTDEHYYKKQLEQAAIKRRMIEVSLNTAEQVSGSTESAEVLLERFQTIVSKINSTSKKESILRIDDILLGKHREDGKSLLSLTQELMEKVQLGQSTLPGISTGWKALDDFIGGLLPGHLIIIGARPGVGKTTFCCNLCVNMAIDQNIPVGFFSLEMSHEEITKKFLSNISNVDHQKLARGELSSLEFSSFVAQAIAKMMQSPNIYVDSQPNLLIGELKLRAKRMKEVYGVKAIIIDYLGYISCKQYEGNKVEQVSFISKELKVIARELNIPVICICQLNRGPANEKRRPAQSDLRDSGQIEANADEIIMLHRPELDDKNNAPAVLELIIEKNRYGARGILKSTFNGATGKIEMIDMKQACDSIRNGVSQGNNHFKQWEKDE